MSRGRDFFKTTLATALIPILLAGCIFSPPRTEEPPPEPPKPPEKAEDLVDALADAYRTSNIDRFTALLANDPDHRAEYIFFLDESTLDPGSDTQWGFTEEVRIHRRMFNPQDVPAGEQPVNPDFWLVALTITLTQETSFTDRADLYESSSNPDGLSPDKWKVQDSIYRTSVFFDLQGPDDFNVEGRANFVVLEDLTKNVGDAGKFLLLHWSDLGGLGAKADLPS